MKFKVGKLTQHGYYKIEGSGCGVRLVLGEKVLIYKTVKDMHYIVLPGINMSCISFAKVHESWCSIIKERSEYMNIPEWIEHFFTNDESITTSINKRPIKV